MGIKSIVTIHDLIFLRYPAYYKFIDRKIYTTKFRHACKHANKIIAISHQTKTDVINFFNIPPGKIEVIYQSCHERFMNPLDELVKSDVQKKFSLPSDYILYVGTIEERKNLLSCVKALHIGKIDLPLVVVGKKTPYLSQINDYVKRNNLEKQLLLLSNVPDNDLPALYQKAKLFLYPSVFEGFGIPVLESLYSKTPVITSIGSCFREAGGEHSIYINPLDPEEMAYEIKRVLTDKNLAEHMVNEGYKHALNFNQQNISLQINTLYKTLVHG
jgi:glycosyltransferase involved in cell wall biosynthesis